MTAPETQPAVAEPGSPAAPETAPVGARKKMILRTVLFVVGGALVGLLYHRLVGCRSGACPITGNPYVATLYGAVLGFLLAR
jgi:hypothetical protein